VILPTDLGYLALALHVESLQSSFIGSEYGPCLAGVNDNDNHKSLMNQCKNANQSHFYQIVDGNNVNFCPIFTKITLKESYLVNMTYL